MIFRETKKIKGVFEISLEPHEDERGLFARTYDKKIFEEHGIAGEWVQENESFSGHKGTLRGLHFQFPPDWEGKLMRLAQGEAFMVWVDLRKNSATFGQWDSLILSAQKKNMLYTPRGFANGNCTLTDNCSLLYKMDNYYNPANQGAILWNDPELNIDWPVKTPEFLSGRDAQAQTFRDFVKMHGGF